MYGLGGYFSWVATTVFLNDVHASWLVPAFIMTGLVYFERAKNASWIKKCSIYGLMLFGLGFAGFGCVFAIRTGVENPRVNLYEYDLRSFDSNFHLTETTVFGAREIMWYFEFDSNVAFPRFKTPEYYIDSKQKAEESKNVCKQTYALKIKGKKFALYRLKK
jgi:hypothetical protein